MKPRPDAIALIFVRKPCGALSHFLAPNHIGTPLPKLLASAHKQAAALGGYVEVSAGFKSPKRRLEPPTL